MFKIATEHFRQDLREFWNRANFYLLINTGLFSAFLIVYPSLVSSYPIIVVIVPALGIAISVVWFLVLRGAYYWISQWREEVIRLSEVVDRFQCYAKIEKSLKKRLFWSPSYLTKFLPLIFLLAWIAILAIFLLEIFGIWEVSSVEPIAILL
jgi:hypothetical protein